MISSAKTRSSAPPAVRDIFAVSYDGGVPDSTETKSCGFAIITSYISSWPRTKRRFFYSLPGDTETESRCCFLYFVGV